MLEKWLSTPNSYTTGDLNSFLPGGGEFAHQKNCPRALPRGEGGGGGENGQAWN